MPKMNVDQLIHTLEKLTLDNPDSKYLTVYLPDGDELWGANLACGIDGDEIVELY